LRFHEILDAYRTLKDNREAYDEFLGKEKLAALLTMVLGEESEDEVEMEKEKFLLGHQFIDAIRLFWAQYQRGGGFEIVRVLYEDEKAY
jgi:DnaJ-class molecular chaperone